MIEEEVPSHVCSIERLDGGTRVVNLSVTKSEQVTALSNSCFSLKEDNMWGQETMIFLEVAHQGRTAPLLLDTGARPSLLSFKTAEHLGVLGMMKPTSYTATLANSSKLDICGIVTVPGGPTWSSGLGL